VYVALFGAFVHRYRYAFVEGKTFKSGDFSKVMASEVEESGDANDGVLKKVWEFLKKLV